MAFPHPSTAADAAFVSLSSARRAHALATATRVVTSFDDRVVLVDLPGEAPLAPTCAIEDAGDGATLVVVSSNGAATSLLVGPGQTLVELPDDLDQAELDRQLEIALRDAIEGLLRP
ncbi:MAG: hypothetical protein Q7T55_25980 [Solirubrobacteraceae bacterium]|nr:hypothetical protein [Solirubrobacteraceae bacterium]